MAFSDQPVKTMSSPPGLLAREGEAVYSVGMYTKNNRFPGLLVVLVLTLMSIPAPAALAAGAFATPPGGTYTVRANDTLWDIAARYDMTVAQLTAANPNINPDTLRPGQTLTIPGATPSAAAGITYTVKANDTLWEIASRYGLFVNDLLAANPGVDPQRLRIGQPLRIPSAGNAGQAAPPARAIYTVRADDTLWDIAANYGLSVDDLLAANSGVDPRHLMVGQQLIIPGITPDLLAAAQAVAPVQQPAAPEAPAAPPQAAGISAEAQDMLNRINEKRAASGRAPYIWNAELAAAAQAHAADCAQRNRGSHVGSDGARLAARLGRVGYAASWASENWANARSVAHAMALWLNEPPGADPHVQNILSTRATEIGIGVAKGAWGYYFIADFGNR